ncbi:MAG: pitrilysin family protein [Planctomycetota bacterium]|nr:pitrilysin family protein [Planctomycetota bacterium]
MAGHRNGSIARFSRMLPLLFLLGCAGSAGTSEPVVKEQETQSRGGIYDTAQERVLKNGLRIIVLEKHDAPVVAAFTAYHAGSADDLVERKGRAHFLEHMMFKGTDKYRKGEIDSITQRAGGTNNAYCAEDVTAYHFTLPASEWHTPLEIEASRMRNCALDKVEFDLERQVVLSELAEALDAPDEALYDEVNFRLYAGHVYASPILGYRADLESLACEEMRDFYARYYSPDNAVLVIAGDVDAEKVFGKARELLEKIDPDRSKRPNRARLPAREQKKQRFELSFNTSLGQIMAAFSTVSMDAPDDAVALDALAVILGEGKTSRLYRRLVERDRLASSVTAISDVRVLGGAFYASAELLPGVGHETAEAAIMAELAHLGMEGPTEREIRRAKNSLRLSFLRDSQYSANVAENIGYNAVCGFADFAARYIERLDDLTTTRLREIAGKYLRADTCVIGWLVPGEEEEGEEEEGEEQKSEEQEGKEQESRGASREVPLGKGGFRGLSAKTPVLPKLARRQDTSPPAGCGATAARPETWKVQLANGLTVLVVGKESAPIVSVAVDVDVRHSDDPPGKAGLGNFVGALLDSGTATRSRNEILEPFEELGTELICGARGVRFDVLPDDLEKALEIAVDIVRNASFSEDSIGEVRNRLSGEISSLEEEPDTQADWFLAAAIYKGHPLQYPRVGTRDTIAAITHADIVEHHAKFFRPGNTIVVVSGDVDAARVVGRLRELTRDWQAGAGPVSRASIPQPMRQATGGEPIVEPRDTEQLYIVLGHLGITRDNPDYHALLVMDQILGGGSGFTDRLQRQLRDVEGLAYIVSSDITDSAGVEPGVFRAFIGTAPENMERAIAGIKREVTAVRSAPPTPEELADAKRYLVGTHSVAFEGVREYARHMVECERFGLGDDYIERFPAIINSIAGDDVQRAASRWLDPEALVVVVVGPVEEDAEEDGEGAEEEEEKVD